MKKYINSRMEVSMEKKRVVVTGMGAITPIGIGMEEFWNGIKEEKISKLDFIKTRNFYFMFWASGTCLELRSLE